MDAKLEGERTLGKTVWWEGDIKVDL